MVRKKYSKELKAQIALDAIKGQKTIAELASEYGVHANQISIWKKQLLDAAPAAFSNGKDKDAEKKEVERDHLYKKVGQLQIEVDWLKKDRLSGMSVSEKVKCIDGNDKMIRSLVLAGSVSCCNCHALHTTDPDRLLPKVLTTWYS